MTTPTQAQIEAAAKAMAVMWMNNKRLKGTFEDLAEAALTAAAQVGEAKMHWSTDEIVSAARQEERVRCAQVLRDKAAEIEAWSHQDNASQLAAEMLRKSSVRVGENAVCPDCKGERRFPGGALCKTCNGLGTVAAQTGPSEETVRAAMYEIGNATIERCAQRVDNQLRQTWDATARVALEQVAAAIRKLKDES